MDPLARLRSFPNAPSPNHDVTAIRGNLTLEQKQLNANALAYHVAAGTKVFASDSLRELKLLEVNVRPRANRNSGGSQGEDTLEGEMICEITVKDGMLNVHGGLAGSCSVAILEILTFGALFALGSVLNIDPTGMSTALETKWYAPALPGMILTAVGTSLSMKGRIYSSRAELYDKHSGRLLAFATHSIAPLKDLASAKDKKRSAKL